MHRSLSVIVLTALLLSPLACSSKKAPDQSAVRGRNILSVLREMSRSYETKDLDTFLSDVSDTYPDRAALAKALTAVFGKYETIHFNIQYTRLIILIEQKGPTRAMFTWDAEWQKPGGSALKDGGRVTMVFDTGSNKLLSIDGKNPFLAQPGETPGK
jgi:hypothetical protein